MRLRLSINSPSYARLISFIKRCYEPNYQIGFTNQGESYRYSGTFTYQINLPDTNWNWNNIICKQCHKNRLTPMPGTNELCCKICGALETLDGAYFEAEELHKCGDFKIVKTTKHQAEIQLQVLHGKTQKNHLNKRTYTIR